MSYTITLVDRPTTMDQQTANALTKLQATVQRHRGTEAEIATLEREHLSLLTQADKLYNAAAEVEGRINRLRQELDAPDTKAAMAVVRQFSALLGQGSCSTK